MSNLVKEKAVSDRAEFYLTSLDKLIDQDVAWFCRRVEFLQQKKYSEVERIEEIYLEPLQVKIKLLARRVAEEFK
jgi:hypothetical protein